MDKAQACEYLGVSERTLANYVSSGRLKAGWAPGKTRPKADYAEEDLKVLKEDLANRAITGIVQSPANQAETSNPATMQKAAKLSNPANSQNPANGAIVKASAGLQDSRLQGSAGNFSPASASFDDVAGLLSESIRIASQSWAMNLSAKKVLTVEQARELTGFSEGTIREAIKEGKLRSKKVGRSIRILPGDLDNWLKTMFEE